MEEKKRKHDVLLIADESAPILIEAEIAMNDNADRLYQPQKALADLQRKSKEE